MITTDFAPNESCDDAWLSLKLLLQPWRWKKGNENNLLNQKINHCFQLPASNFQLSYFLSGRSALYFLLKSLKLPAGSEVIVQAFTCEAVVLPIIAVGLKPIYVDIEPQTFSMSYRSLINRLTDNSRVLILQHTFGLTPKFREEILELAQRYKLTVIEDLAHGFNPKIFSSKNLPLATNFFLLSFGRSKLLSSVFGGAILFSSNETTSNVAEAIEQFNNLDYPSYCFILRCLLYKPLTMLIKSTYDFYLGKILHKFLNFFNLLIPEITKKEKNGEYNHIFDKTYPNALAVLLLHQLNKFEQIQKQRAIICRIYQRSLAKNNQQSTINNSSMIRFPLIVNNRSEILTKAREKNIFLGKWYDQVVVPKDLNLDRVEYKPGSCPKAEEVCKKIINLPTNISEDEAKKIIKVLNDVK